MCKVSVVIPLFNAVTFIEETLQSVFNQTFENIEVIIVDDDSTDGSFELAKKYQSDTVKVVKNKDKGACAARNYGFELSSGDYIQYLDADDLLSSNKIESQVKVLNGVRDQLAVCNTIHFYETPDTGICTDTDYVFSTDAPEDLFIKLWGGLDSKMNMIQTSAWLTPRALIEEAGSWNEQLAKDQDGEFFARVGLQSKGIIYVPEAKNYYRKHIKGSNIASQKQRKHIKSNLLATDLKSQYLFNISQSQEAKLAIATQYKHVAMDAWPEFKDITKKAMEACQDLGGSFYKPKLGGSVIELIKSVFGWRIAKSVSFYGHKLMKR
ncbi:glycosyltransferase [Mangrovimonas sp. YM274]|uniref:glycosyltransferase family 2 protein n=1 Tax=Mangrovimonas sp. YM274 TaxID=3070660 RepID=UPI0027DCDAE3|nr:glycosyltransferase [Mangrovimonas sp. YM274]WMI68450.1 glycosyltransferase [Mangrovimonas sp. YM274]